MKKDKKKKNKSFKIAFVILGLAVIIGIVRTLITFTADRDERIYSVSTMTLLYKDADTGTTPNGGYFSTNAFRFEDLIYQALASIQMADKYSPALIAENLEIVPRYPSDIVEQYSTYDSLLNYDSARQVTLSSYTPTSYTITLHSRFDENISADNLNKILAALESTFNSYFYSTAVYSLDTVEMDSLSNPNEYDYIHTVDILTTKLDIISSYASSLYNKDHDFRYNSLCFKDIADKANAIKSNDLSALDAYTTLNAVTTDSERLLSTYEFNNERLNIRRTEKESSLQSINTLIENFTKDDIFYIGNDESILKIESSSGSTYEKLIEEKRKLEEDITSLDTKISQNKLRIKDLQDKSKNTEANQTKVKTTLGLLLNQIDELRNTFNEMLTAYNAKILPVGSLSFAEPHSVSYSVFSASFIIHGIKTAGPYVVVALIIFTFIGFLNAIKKGKKTVTAEKIQIDVPKVQSKLQ